MNIGYFRTLELGEQDIVNGIVQAGHTPVAIDIYSDDFGQQLRSCDCQGFLLRAPTQSLFLKSVFLKRLLLYREELQGRCVPTLEGLLIYESKILMYDYFRKLNLPFPKTRVTFGWRQALASTGEFASRVMVKFDGGSCGNGVEFRRNDIFLKLNILRFFALGSKFSNFRHHFHIFPRRLEELLRRLVYSSRTGWNYFPQVELNSEYFIIQERVAIKHEWRAIVIGDHYFVHKKVADRSGKHSGTKRKEFGMPDRRLLEFVRRCVQKTGLNCAAYDLFETNESEFLLNEIQVTFGTREPDQMFVDGKPGALVYQNQSWNFIEQANLTVHNANALKLKLVSWCKQT